MSDLTHGRAIRETNLGLRTVKTASGAADIDLFTIFGECVITLLYGIVTGAGDGSVTTIKINEKASSIDLCAASTVSDSNVGEVYLLTGDPAIILNGTGSTYALKVGMAMAAFPVTPLVIDGQSGLILELTATGTDATFAVKWVIHYVPAEDDAYIEAA